MIANTIHANVLKETTGIIVHGANAQGAFNAGFAKKVREKYPEVFSDYREHYLKLSPNRMLGTVIFTQVGINLYIATGITQYLYDRDPNYQYVNYDAITQVFKQVGDFAIANNLEVKYPAIGVGLGNGNWDIINNLIHEALPPEVKHTLFLYKR